MGLGITGRSDPGGKWLDMHLMLATQSKLIDKAESKVFCFHLLLQEFNVPGCSIHANSLPIFYLPGRILHSYYGR